MGHDHNGHHHHHNSSKNIKIAFILNFSFTILEIIGGIWTNSIAIISDALHDLGDSLSLGLAWFLERYSKKEADKKYTFGYARFSLLGALINSIVLIVGSTLILTKSIPRIFYPEDTNPHGMLILAIIGILVNGAAVFRLRKGSSVNEKVVSWHLLEDVLGWLAILIVSLVLMVKDIPILDPLLSIIITVIVIYNVIKNLKNIMSIFLQGTPYNLNLEEIEEKIQEIPNIKDIHHTHVWSLEGEKNLLTTHIVLDDQLSKDTIINIKHQVKETMHQLNISHVTLEVDFKSEDCQGVHCKIK